MAITKRIDGAYTISATGGISLSNAIITAGTGITSVATAIVKHSVITIGQIIETTIILDLTGLNSGDADGDIIGKAGTANSHYGQITTAINGTILSGYIQCLETPAGGESDIDLYSATEATGTEESLITALTETALLNTDGDWVGKHLSTKLNTLASNGTIKADSAILTSDIGNTIDLVSIVHSAGLTTIPPANGYLYLVASGGSTNATYTAGKFLIKLYGYA